MEENRIRKMGKKASEPVLVRDNRMRRTNGWELQRRENEVHLGLAQ